MSSNSSKIRKLPNILVTGTPGVGKSTLCKMLSEVLNLQWLEVSRISKENNFLLEYDTIYKCSILDEDKLLDYMEPKMLNGGCIVDYHSSDFFPKRWFDAVYVLTADTKILFDRLEERQYSKRKIRDNIECEIFNWILEETQDSYDAEIIHVLKSNDTIQLKHNMQEICSWVENWYLENTSVK